MKRLTDKQRTALLKPIQAALSQQTRATRADLFDRYMDEPYGDEVKGLSQFRATDGADVVETVFAEAMEALAGDDDLVEFVPHGQDDEQHVGYLVKAETMRAHSDGRGTGLGD